MITRDPNDLPYEAYRNMSLREQRLVDSMFAQTVQNHSESSQLYLVNNRSSSYCPVKDHKMLVVNEVPRSLRPDENLTDSVIWDKRNREHIIRNSGPADQHAFSAGSLHIEPQHNLCPPCRDLLNAFCQNNDSNVVIWHGCIASLMVSVECHKCYVCNMILDTHLWPRFPSLLTNAPGLTDFALKFAGIRPGMQKE
jgi:hypothetical protein